MVRSGGGALLAALLLVSCGGGGGDTAPTVEGSVVKGPVAGATVCAYALPAGAKGAQLPLAVAAGATGAINGGCYVTAADGSYAFTLPAGTSGDVLLEATGGTFCASEAPVAANACAGGAAPISLGNAVMTSVTTVAAASRSTVHTTPLTSAAVRARRNQPLTAVDFQEAFTTLAGKVLGPTTSVTPSTAPTVASQPYLAAVAASLQAGGSLDAAVDALAQGSTSLQSGGGTPATVNAALAGTYQLVFDGDCAGRCGFSNGQAVTVTVHADGRLAVGSLELANPFHRDFGAGPHLPEAIWLDAQARVEYALSDNSKGVFNEINVGDASRPQPAGFPFFLGQLRAPGGKTGSTPPAATTTVSVTPLTPLTGTQTYTLLYASTRIGTDIRPATAAFSAANTLKAYVASEQEGLDIGTMTNSEANGSAALQVGRWNNGQFAGRYYAAVTSTTTFSLTADQGFHYAIAQPPAALPCSGRTTYTLAAGTRPTREDGSQAPGSFDTLTVSVTFNGSGPVSYESAGSITLGGSSITFSGTGTATPGPRKAFNLTMPTVSTGVAAAGAYGVFAGADASEFGLVLSGLAPGGVTAQSVRAAARLVRSSSTAVACS
jgi:hypothetical protein